MFNEKLKERFLEDAIHNNNRKNNFITLFNFTEQFENKENKDLNALSTAQLQEIINALPGGTMFNSENKVSMIKIYCEWCLNNRVIKELTWRKGSLNLDRINTIKETTIKNPIHLQKCLDEVFDPEESETNEIILRCYLWLAYIGLNETDAINITSDNVDLNNRKINVGEREFYIYEQAVCSIRKCIELKEFVINHPNYVGAKKERCSGNKLLRISGKSESSLRIREELSRKFKKYSEENNSQIRLSYNRVVSYGVFYRMLQQEIADGYLNLDAGLQELIYAKKMKNNPIVIKRGLKKDYELWKRAVIT